ncbi:MAG: hypothetical protein ACOC8F_04920 [Planctomycetota bacterium]
MSAPAWLPPLLTLGECQGDWHAYIGRVYEVFRRDFVQRSPIFRGRPVHIKRRPTEQGRERGFWHVTSAGKREAQRLPDIRRCERIRWLRAIIEHADDAAVKVWENERHGKPRTVLWAEEAEFLLVLEARKDAWVLWTAYPVTEQRRKRSLQREYEQSRKS